MNFRRFLGISLSIFSFVAAAPAFAQIPTAVTVDVPPTAQAGDALTVLAMMHVTLPQCPPPNAPVGGTLTLKTSSGASYTWVPNGYLSCVNGVYSDGARLQIPGPLSPGPLTFSVDYSGATGIGSSSTGPVTIQVLDGFSGTTGQGTVKVKVSGVQSEFGCPMHSASVIDGPPPGAPAGLSFPTGYVSYAFTACETVCSGFCPPPPDTPDFPGQLVTLQLPQPPAPGSKVWVYAPGGGISTPVWRRLEPQIDGNTVKVIVTGNRGSGVYGTTELRGVLAVASGDGNRSDLQDLWWGGPQENGWGVGISQIGDRMFLGLYVYGVFTTAGSPVWFVMPGGTWDAAHTSFSGSVYMPQSPNSSYASYSSRDLSIGSPAMNGKITFSGNSSADLELTPRDPYGYPGTIHKSLVRQPFGTSSEPGPFAGLWWGGAEQNGWGISLAQQGDTLFAVWYTYDKPGAIPTNNTWLVMPGGTWTTRNTFGGTYTGTLYRTKGPQWLASTYDPSQLVVTPAGSLTLTFYTSDVARMDWTIDGVPGRVYSLYKQPF